MKEIQHKKELVTRRKMIVSHVASTMILRLIDLKTEKANTLIKEIEDLEKLEGITSKEMAKRLRISPQYLIDIKKGRRGFSESLLRKLSVLD